MAEPKAQKAKRKSTEFKVVSTAGTGYFYIVRRNLKRVLEKYHFRKYDPVARKHVIFEEEKL